MTGTKRGLTTWDRMLLKRSIQGECWIYTGALNSGGYGRIWNSEKRMEYYTHRASYEINIGPVPNGWQIDHLCRVRACFNPAHLEAVTQRENILRGEAPNSIVARTDRCQRGHDLGIEANVYTRRNGERMCWPCQQERNRAACARRRDKKKAEREAA